MFLIEKYPYSLFLLLAGLAVAAFLGLKGPPPAQRSVTDLMEAVPAADAITSGNCGHCTSQGGSDVDCYIPTQRYTCSSKAKSCADTCR